MRWEVILITRGKPTNHFTSILWSRSCNWGRKTEFSGKTNTDRYRFWKVSFYLCLRFYQYRDNHSEKAERKTKSKKVFTGSWPPSLNLSWLDPNLFKVVPRVLRSPAAVPETVISSKTAAVIQEKVKPEQRAAKGSSESQNKSLQDHGKDFARKVNLKEAWTQTENTQLRDQFTQVAIIYLSIHLLIITHTSGWKYNSNFGNQFPFYICLSLQIQCQQILLRRRISHQSHVSL